MKELQGPYDYLNLAHDFLMEQPAKTPDLFREKLKAIVKPGALPVPLAIRDVAELVYAWRKKLPKSMIEIGLQCTNFLIIYSQFDYQKERGPGMVAAFNGGDGPEPQEELTPEGLAPAPVTPPEAPTPPDTL